MNSRSCAWQNLSKLTSWHLDDAQLALEGQHPAFGAVTLRQLLATWVAHDLGHMVQVQPCDGEAISRCDRTMD